MRTIVLGTAVLTALASPTIAADMRPPIRKAPAAVVAAWSWTGCHVGGHVGGFWASKRDWTVRTPGGAFFGESLGSHDANGLIGGVQAGCDYHFAGGFVVGIQGGYAWTDAEGSHDSAREFGVAYHSKVTSLATATGRIGYAWDRFLGYVKGGGAWERGDYWATTTILGTAYRANATRPGWTIGVGGEYAFSNVVSGFVEYGYHDFGTRDLSLTPQVPGLRQGFVDITERASVLRAGLNLRFGG